MQPVEFGAVRLLRVEERTHGDATGHCGDTEHGERRAGRERHETSNGMVGAGRQPPIGRQLMAWSFHPERPVGHP